MQCLWIGCQKTLPTDEMQKKALGLQPYPHTDLSSACTCNQEFDMYSGSGQVSNRLGSFLLQSKLQVVWLNP